VNHLIVGNHYFLNISWHLGGDDGDVTSNVGIVRLLQEASCNPPMASIPDRGHYGGKRGKHQDAPFIVNFVWLLVVNRQLNRAGMLSGSVGGHFIYL
jgi:hypothetical protein